MRRLRIGNCRLAARSRTEIVQKYDFSGTDAEKAVLDMIFGKRKAEETYDNYDKERQKPVLRCSICNGEQIAGFKDIQTGKFQEIMLIKNESDLDEFMKRYHLTEISKEY